MNSVRKEAMSPEGSIALLCGQRHGPSCSTAAQSSLVTAAPTAAGSVPALSEIAASWT